MIKEIILYWFKKQAAKEAPALLIRHYSQKAVQEILHGYWQRYLELKPDVPVMPTLGGSVTVNLAAMSTAFYLELIEKGEKEERGTQLFYEIAWKIYRKMGKFSWLLSGIGNFNNSSRLTKATQLFRAFPFNSPSYQWEEVQTNENIVGFNCTKCPVAEYFLEQGLSNFCSNTWCALDFPLAELWHSKLERTGSIAAGAEKCDFRWVVDSNEKTDK